MKGKTVSEKIIEKLDEYGIKVYKITNQFEQTIIMAENLIVSYSNGEVLVNFHLCSKPCYAARVMVILKEVKGIKRFMVGDDFIFDNEGKYLEGEEADKIFEEFQEKNIIDNFLDEQKTLYLLTHAEGYRC